MTWICCAGHWVHTEDTRGKRTAYSGSCVGDRSWPFLYKLCCGVSVPDNAKHKPFHPLLRGFPSAHSVKVGWLTHCWPSARPVTPYQADYPTFISLGAGGGTFRYSQVEAIDSLCTVVIYSILKGLFWVITSEKKHQSFDARQRGANSHYTFTRVGKPFVNLFSLFKSTPKISSNSEGTMQLNLWNSIIFKKSSVTGCTLRKPLLRGMGSVGVKCYTLPVVVLTVGEETHHNKFHLNLLNAKWSYKITFWF